MDRWDCDSGKGWKAAVGLKRAVASAVMRWHHAQGHRGESMWDWLRYRWQLSKLQKSLRKTQRLFDSHIEGAIRNPKHQGDINKIRHERYIETRIIDDQISILVTRYLVGKANRLFLPIPEDSEKYWEESDILGQHYMTAQGITEMRRSIRAERSDASAYWVSISSALIGVIGALTGLVALLIRHS